jgi:tight adherence protein B
MVGGVYAALAVRVVSRQRSARQTLREHRRRLDELCGLAADLRAGIPASVAIGRLSALRHSPDTTGGPLQDGSDRISALLQAAGRIAERTGAPLADLVERIEADARARDRGLAAARAQAAGGQATAWLLAGLPVGGIALGYGIGVDPLEVLLRTPIGAGCAVAAVALQLAGLAWSDRLGSAFDRVD